MQRRVEGWLFPNEDELTYTIRFQNTGNDTAFFVRIQDTLDATSLDVESIRFIDGTHPFKANIYQGQYLVVRFDHILLPDSATNPEGSQGHVIFSINKKKNLPPHSLIQNCAAIYFDFNKPIIPTPYYAQPTSQW